MGGLASSLFSISFSALRILSITSWCLPQSLKAPRQFLLTSIRFCSNCDPALWAKPTDKSETTCFFSCFSKIPKGQDVKFSPLTNNSMKNKKRSSFFKETFFIDVFMHELGHALGIPHLRHDDLMFLTLDACGDKSTVCRPSDLTFESFLAVYEPEIYTPPPPSPPLSCPTYRNGRMFLCP